MSASVKRSQGAPQVNRAEKVTAGVVVAAVLVVLAGADHVYKNAQLKPLKDEFESLKGAKRRAAHICVDMEDKDRPDVAGAVEAFVEASAHPSLKEPEKADSMDVSYTPSSYEREKAKRELAGCRAYFHIKGEMQRISQQAQRILKR